LTLITLISVQIELSVIEKLNSRNQSLEYSQNCTVEELLATNLLIQRNLTKISSSFTNIITFKAQKFFKKLFPNIRGKLWKTWYECSYTRMIIFDLKGVLVSRGFAHAREIGPHA
jgi:hypothetical protein